MLQPGRSFSNGNQYRYGFGGQEKELEVNENITSAKYWEYDSRIGRRWNIDPVFKANESPYAVFGNNPIWNVDHDGSDTAKYLSNGQLVDAMKIALNEVKRVLKSKQKFVSKEVDKNLLNAVTAYWEKHHNDMNFPALAEFKESVEQYYNGLATLAWWDGHGELDKLDRAVINNKKINNYLTVVISVGRIRQTESNMWATIGHAANVALFISSAALFPEIGAKPRIVNGYSKPGPALRQAYESEVRNLTNWVKAMRGNGATSEEIARTVSLQRRLLGIKYKEMTPPKLLEQIYKRNLEKYGDKLGPSVDWLRAKGKSWDEIIESATRPGGSGINFNLQ